MTEIRITIAGHMNHGKTSIIRTLSDDATFGLVDDRRTTDRIAEQLLTGPALSPDLLRVCDTPGLELASEALASLFGRKTFAGVVNYFETRGGDTQDLAVLRQVRERTDVILYVVRLTEPVKQDYKDEFHILRISGVPLIPIFNFVSSKNSHKDAWIAYLKTEGCHEYTEYDAHAWEPSNEQILWDRVKAKLHEREQIQLVEAWRDTRLRRAKEKDEKAAKVIAESLQKVAAFRIETRIESSDEARQTIKNKAKEDFAEGVRDLERNGLISILEAYQLNMGIISRVIMNCAGPSIDTATEKTIRDGFATGIVRGAATGAATGGTFDACVGGASFMTGAVIGSIVGGVWAARDSFTNSRYDKLTNSYYKKPDSTFTIRSSPEILEIILDRALTLTRDLRRRGFANQSEPDFTSAKRHVPAAAKELLATLFDLPSFFSAESHGRKAAYKLEVNILRWIEQTPK